MNHIKNEKKEYNSIVNVLWKNIQKETLDVQEQKELDEWLSSSEYNRDVYAELSDENSWDDIIELLLVRDSEVTWKKILGTIEAETVPQVADSPKLKRLPVRLGRFAAAAVVLIALMTGAYYLFTDNSDTKDDLASGKIENDAVLPGSSKALLTLADGSVVDLTKTNGNIDLKDGRLKLSNNIMEGELVLDADRSINDAQVPITLNTLSLFIPKGGCYKVILPDGTKVWLNAASTLRFPTSFTSNERTVELTGEAYFEVKPVFPVVARPGSSEGTKQPAPFHVKAKGVDVRVLSTDFNVKAYTEEREVATTLVEGAVVVSKADLVCQLKPGQQATVSDGLPVKPIRLARVNSKDASAWKKGYFAFSGLPLEDILNQVARWYDIEIVYHGVKTDKKFGGAVNRNTSISGIIKLLENNGFKAVLNGRVMTISTL